MAPRISVLPSLARDPWLYAVWLVVIGFHGPALRSLIWLGDEGVVLHAAQRMLRGQTLYRDFFEVLAPGSFWIAALWMKLFGAGFGSARVLALGTLVVIASLVYVAVRAVSGSRLFAAALAAAWAVRADCEVNHHWFTTAASMAAGVSLLSALDRDDSSARRWWLISGLFAGAAALMTQSRGTLMCVALLLAAVMASTSPAASLRYSAVGIAVAPVLATIALLAMGSLTAAYRDAVRYPLDRYAGIQGVPFGTPHGFGDLVVAFYLLTFLLTVVVLLVPDIALWRAPRFRGALLLAIVGFIGAYPRPDIPHLVVSMPLLCPLFALALTPLLGRVRAPLRRVVSAALVAGFLLDLGTATLVRSRMLTAPKERLETARGPIELRAGTWAWDLEALLGAIRATGSEDAFLFYPYMPMLPYLTARRHIARLDVVLPGYTTSAEYAEICKQALTRARWVVIDHAWSNPAALRSLFPAMKDADPPEKRRLEAALAVAFERVHTSLTFDLRRRTGTATDDLCAEDAPKKDGPRNAGVRDDTAQRPQ